MPPCEVEKFVVVKVATWNINGLKARLNFLRLFLDERQPDLVGLQELKMTDAVFPHEFFAELGYTAVSHGQKSWNGVAVLSRLPMATVQGGCQVKTIWVHVCCMCGWQIPSTL